VRINRGNTVLQEVLVLSALLHNHSYVKVDCSTWVTPRGQGYGADDIFIHSNMANSAQRKSAIVIW